jgi:hypothetical protein
MPVYGSGPLLLPDVESDAAVKAYNSARLAGASTDAAAKVAIAALHKKDSLQLAVMIRNWLARALALSRLDTRDVLVPRDASEEPSRHLAPAPVETARGNIELSRSP